MNLASYMLFGIALLIVASTVVLLFKFQTFYLRVLISANIDTVAMIFFMAAVFLSSPNYEFVLKALLVLVMALITNPLSAHATARSAHMSGYRPREVRGGK